MGRILTIVLSFCGSRPRESDRGRVTRFITPKVVTAWWLGVVIAVAAIVSSPGKAGKLYPTFATAGEQFLTAEPVYGDIPEHLDQFRYSPTVAALMAPWSLLPWSVGGVLWRAIQAALLLLALRRAVRTLWPELSWPLVALGCLPLVAGNLHNGQFNPLVLALLLFAASWFAEGRLNLAAVAVAGATLIKVYPLAFGLLLGLTAWRSFSPRLFFALVAGLAVPYLFHSADYVDQQYADWLARLAIDDRSERAMGAGYFDFQKVLRRWGMPVTLEAYRVIEVTAGGLMAAFLIWVRRDKSRAETVRLSLLLALVWCCLFGPSSETATYMLLAPAAVVALCESRGRHVIPGVVYGLLVSVTGAMWLPKPIRMEWMALTPQAHAALLLLGWLVWQNWPVSWKHSASTADVRPAVYLTP